MRGSTAMSESPSERASATSGMQLANVPNLLAPRRNLQPPLALLDLITLAWTTSPVYPHTSPEISPGTPAGVGS